MTIFTRRFLQTIMQSMSPTLPPLLIFPRSFQVNQYICSSCIQSPQRLWKPRRAVSTAAQILKDEDPKPQDFTPKPLARPLGVLYPPQPGENSGIDPRPWRQRRDDLFDYNKHLVRRKELYNPPPFLSNPSKYLSSPSISSITIYPSQSSSPNKSNLSTNKTPPQNQTSRQTLLPRLVPHPIPQRQILPLPRPHLPRR